MIIVSKPSKPFELTSKLTPRRHVVIKSYSQEIKALYEKVKESAQEDIPAPGSWTVDSTIDYVRKVVNKVIKLQLSDDSDFFLEGCDRSVSSKFRSYSFS